MDKPELLPPTAELDRMSSWFPRGEKWGRMPGVRVIACAVPCIPLALWCLNEFFQLRGVVSVIASRLCLAGIVIGLGLPVWVWALNLRRLKSLAGLLATVMLLASAVALDRVTLPHLPATPVPPTNSLPPSPTPASPNVPSKSVPTPAKPQVPLVPPPKPYDISTERRQTFLRFAKPPLRNANKLRIGCISWSERACVAAGQFLLLLSQAGWTIDENRVFRMEEPVPTEGASIVSQPEPGPPLPPHLGRWHALSLSEVTLAGAFVAIGVVQSGSSDPSLANGTTGVYFGVEPRALKLNKDLLAEMQLSRLKGEIDDIQQRPRSDPAAQSADEFAWNSEAEEWLRFNAGISVSRHFRGCTGEKAKVDYFNQERLRLSLALAAATNGKGTP